MNGSTVVGHTIEFYLQTVQVWICPSHVDSNAFSLSGQLHNPHPPNPYSPISQQIYIVHMNGLLILKIEDFL